MLRKLSFTAAILVLTASWVSAGNLGALANAAASQAPTPLYVNPGAVVKAEYRSGLKATADEDTSVPAIKPERVAASTDRAITARPAIAFKPKPSGMMAPPPKVEPVGNSQAGLVAEAKQDSLDLEGDLEKDLVLSPPPQKTEETTEIQAKPVVSEAKPEVKKPAVATAPKKAPSKVVAKRIRKVKPTPQYAGSPKPIRKVHPISQGNWQLPAGSYQNRPFPQTQTAIAGPNYCTPNFSQNRMAQPNYALSAPRPGLGAEGQTDRVVRDGITIKLAPAAAPVTAPMPPYEADQRDDSSGSDLLSSAAEIIGLPFAFISSLF